MIISSKISLSMITSIKIGSSKIVLEDQLFSKIVSLS